MTAADIPESIVIDVSELEVGDNVTISDVTLPAGAKPTIDRDFVIAQLSAPSALASQSDDDEDEGEGDDVAADEVPTAGDDAEGDDA